MLQIQCHDHNHHVGLYIVNLNGEFNHPSRNGLDELNFSTQDLKLSGYMSNVFDGLYKVKTAVEKHQYLTVEFHSDRPKTSQYVRIIPMLLVNAPTANEYQQMAAVVQSIGAAKIHEVDSSDRTFAKKLAFTTDHRLKVEGVGKILEDEDPIMFFEMNRYEFTYFEDLFADNPYRYDVIAEGTRCIGVDLTKRRILKDRINSLLHIGDESYLVRFIKTGAVPSAIVLARHPERWTDGAGVSFTHTSPKLSGFNLYLDLMRHHDVRRFFLRNLLFVKTGGDWTYAREVVRVFDNMRKWDDGLKELTAIKDLLSHGTYADMDNSQVADDIANYLHDIFSMQFFNFIKNPLLPDVKASAVDLSQPGFYVIDISGLSEFQEYAILCYIFAMYTYRKLPHYVVSTNSLLYHREGDDRVALANMVDRHSPTSLILGTSNTPEWTVRRLFEMVTMDWSAEMALAEYGEVVHGDQLFVVIRDFYRTIFTDIYESLPDYVDWQPPEQIIPELVLPQLEEEEEDEDELPNPTAVFANMATVMSFMSDIRPYTREEIIVGLDLDDEFVDSALVYLRNRAFVGENDVPTKLGLDYIAQLLAKLPQLDTEEADLVRLSKIKLELFTADLETSRQLYAEAVQHVKQASKTLNTQAYYHLAIGILAGSYQMEADAPIAQHALLNEFIRLCADLNNTTMQAAAMSFDADTSEADPESMDEILDSAGPNTIEEIINLDETHVDAIPDDETAFENVEPLENVDTTDTTPDTPSQPTEPRIRMVEAIVPKISTQAPALPPPRSSLITPRRILTPEDLKPIQFDGLRDWYRFVENNYSTPITYDTIGPLDTFLLYYLFQKLGNGDEQYIKTTTATIRQHLDELDIFDPSAMYDHVLTSRFFSVYGDLVSFSNFNDMFDSTTIKLDALYSRYDLNKVSKLLDDNPELMIESDAIASIIIRDASARVLTQVAAFSFMLLKTEDKAAYTAIIPYCATLIGYSITKKTDTSVYHPLLRVETVSDKDKQFLQRFTSHYTKKQVIKRSKINTITIMRDSDPEPQEPVTTPPDRPLPPLETKQPVVQPVEIKDDLVPLDPSLQQQLLSHLQSSDASPDGMLFYVFSQMAHSITGVRLEDPTRWMQVLKIYNEVGATTNVLTTAFTRQFHDLMQLWDGDSDKEQLRAAYRRVLTEAISKFKYSADFARMLKKRLKE